MRGTFTGVFAVMMVLANAQAVAQSNRPATKSAQELQEIDQRVAEWLKTCLADWEAATHMTKVEWRTTCQRVSAERRKFLIDGPDLTPMGARRR
jgi:hypothetical protein